MQRDARAHLGKRIELAQNLGNNESELAQRHRAAQVSVLLTLGLTLLLIACAYAGLFMGKAKRPDPFLRGALSIAIVLFGFGAVALRRTRFAPARLQDIAALRGVSGLLATLQQTTLLVALLGGAIAVMGFIIAMGTGDASDMLRLGVIAIAVLIYAYPRRSAWRRVIAITQTTDGLDAANGSSPKGTTA